jgi:RND family efflux transporter MFP subunit
MNCKQSTLLCAFLVFLCSSCAFAITDSESGITAITIPSADVMMSFVQPGKIAELFVLEGDTVTADQLLVKQDDTVEQIVLLQTKAQSEDTSQVEGAQASLDQKRVDLKKMEWAAGRGSATELEVEHAQLEVKISELSLKLAQLKHEQSLLKYQEMQARVDRMSLKSSITGTIEKVEVEEGEAVNGLEDVLRVLKTDPLWIDVPVPLAQGRTFKKGQNATVTFPGANKKTTALITYVSTAADAASSTLRVRIEVPNTQERPAGEHVQVSFPTSVEPSTVNP